MFGSFRNDRAYKLLVYKLQLINSKQNQKQLRMKAMDYAYFKLKEKTARSVKKNGNNFINII